MRNKFKLGSTSLTITQQQTKWYDLLILIIKLIIFVIIILSAVLGNALVIISVHRHRKLRVITNYYVVSLAMADMLVALCAMTFNASVELMQGKWLFGYLMCDIWNSFDVYFSTASILHLCCISVDRYYAIVRPLEYPIIMTQRTVIFMLTNVWLLPTFISFIPILLNWYTTPEQQEYRIANPDECSFVVNKYYAVISSSVSFWIPGIVMIIMYYRIYKEAIRQRIALSRTSSNIILNSIHQHRTSTYNHNTHRQRLLLQQQQYEREQQQLEQQNKRLHHFDTDHSDNNLNDHNKNNNADDEPITVTVAVPVPVSVNVNNTTTTTTTTTTPTSSSTTLSNQQQQQRPSTSTNTTSTCTNPSITSNFNKAATELNMNGTTIKKHRKQQSTPITAQTSTTTTTTTTSSSSRNSWRAEHKAARTLGIIMGAFLLCWLPFFLWYVTTTLCGAKCYCPNEVVGMLFWIGYTNSALNPLIYAYFNRDFREAFRDTLQCTSTTASALSPKTSTAAGAHHHHYTVHDDCEDDDCDHEDEHNTAQYV
ncbi:octopamine receptor beta-3R-like [Chrysoperla carnea]|uniref:octopamine receptor beta-3R-like n=1 Tax=Chrysoperla carnea TaxID=189513 RepID=UPI001D082D19|nr:octopamine receptor beta-3R-like [Chrysoperla carnea]